ncbi:histidinol-phosphate transaminase [Saxophila tyrrhenica]|uniref:histidinol-phosphate transaminase n=1 Tax=Saxophila tyrrhenica TaxID=1690608 RepID=A0AAV9PPP4_9PEZI|nr:histidinol-phosphate transaminase [Saxophila tyrrhenica]
MGQTPLFHGRCVKTDQIDLGLVAGWIEECYSTHGKCKSARETVEGDTLGIKLPPESLLLDAEEQCLVQAKPGQRYAALSYVWGAAEQYLLTTDKLDSLRQAGSLAGLKLPLTIQDSLDLVKVVGLRYLWVDALCIIQDDMALKSQLIASMHLVYGAAEVTIVAVDGLHANAGLRGVRPGTRHIDQTSFSTGAGSPRILPGLPRVDGVVGSSRYNERGWTFQELHLSRNILYISATAGAWFRCRQGIRCEEGILEDAACGHAGCQDEQHARLVSEPDGNPALMSCEAELQWHPGGCTCGQRQRERFETQEVVNPVTGPTSGEPVEDVFGPLNGGSCTDCDHFEHSFHNYSSLVRQYTSRSLTNHSDRPAAFAGLAALLQKTHQTSLLYSIPEQYIDQGLLWRPLNNSALPHRRVEGMPSWSWAAWECPVRYITYRWMTTEVDWYIYGEQTGSRPVRSVKRYGTSIPLREDFRRPVTMDQLAAHNLLEPSSPGPELVAWCPLSTGFFYTRGHKLISLHPAHMGLPGHDVLFNDATPRADDPEMRPVELLFLAQAGGRVFWEDMKPKASGMPGYWDELEMAGYALVVERDGGVARRVGFVRIGEWRLWRDAPREWVLLNDYKDDGTNVLLDANENAYGPGLALSEDGKLANGDASNIEVDLLGLNRYPDPHQHDLKQLLINLRNTHVHTQKSLTPANLFVGVGSDEAIDALLRAFCTPGKDKILTCPPTYGMYTVSASVNDVGIVKVPLNPSDNFNAQPDLINKTLSEDPSIKLVYLCSPGNPTANLIRKSDVQAILEHPTWNGVVVLDEAYIDFSPDGSSLAEWVAEWPNLVVMQTLSKAFGLAGIRLGAAFTSPEIARLLNSLKAPYNVSNPTSQIAMHALREKNLNVMRANRQRIIEQRDRMLKQMPGIPGVGRFLGGRESNFLLVEMLGLDGKASNEVALQVYERLAENRGVVVRFRGKEVGCLGCLRVTVGTEEEVTRFLKELREVLAEIYEGRESRPSKRVEEKREKEANGVVA